MELLNGFEKLIKRSQAAVRVIIAEWSFEQLFDECYNPIWNYGKQDIYIQNAFIRMLDQLKFADKQEAHASIFNAFKNKVTSKEPDAF